MKRILLTLILASSYQTTFANSETAAQVCAEAANKMIGDANYSVQHLRQPFLSVPKYRIELQSESLRKIQCVVTSNRLQTIAIDGEAKLASR